MKVFQMFCIIIILTGFTYGYTTKPGLILTFSPDAKSEAVANATGAVSEDRAAPLQNPATLSSLKTKDFSFTYSSYISDISFLSLSLGFPVYNNNIALNIMHLSLGEFKRVLAEGETPITESAGSDTAVVLSYSRWIFGVNFKFLFSKLAEFKGNGFGIDIGILKNNFLFKDFSVGAVIQNLGFGIKFRSEKEPLPLNFKIATAYLLNLRKFRTKFLFDFNIPNYYKPYAGLGCEFDFKFSKDIVLQPRIGYKINQDLGFLSGLTFGFGINYTIFSIDYAYVNYNFLENMNKITLSIRFF